MKILFSLAAVGLLLSAAAAQDAEPGSRRLELPPETITYREAPGVQLAMAFCVTCHSADYAENQAPLPDAYWSGTVKKMKEKFGAPIPDETIDGLTKYLIAAYGSGRKP